MFFDLSKILWAIAMPLNALILLIALGWLVRIVLHEKAGRAMIVTGVAALLIFGILPIGPMMVTWLERQYPPVRDLPEKVDGIIVLGGMFESYLSSVHKNVSVNDQADRIICFIDLARRYPEAKKVFSGGSGDYIHPDLGEAMDAMKFLKMLNLSPDERRILFENGSRNTYENVLYAKDSIYPEKGQTWVMITSGYHMPRAMSVFAAQDWPVTPYPCDQKTDGTYSLFERMPNSLYNFEMLNLAVKEVIGSIMYRITGKSAFILVPSWLPSGHETDMP